MPRSPAEELRIEARRLKVAELYLHGTRCLSQIARELGVDKAQISRDFEQIRKLWRERYIEDWDAAKHEELAKIAEIDWPQVVRGVAIAFMESPFLCCTSQAAGFFRDENG
jgi:hypothetical protein